MADLYPGPDDIISLLTAKRAPPSGMEFPDGKSTFVSLLTAPRATGRNQLPSPASILTRKDVKGA